MIDSTGDTQPSGFSVSRFVVVGILLLAAFLRLYRLDLIGVTNETAYQELTATTALSMVEGDWPLAGPPTEEVRSSSFLVTGIAISKLIRWSPFSGIVFVIGLNLLAIWIVYRMCERQFGLRVAVITTVLYSVSPWGVLYSRFLLSSSCLAFFSILLIHLSFKWLEERGKQQLFMMVLLSTLLPQVHYSGMWVPLWLFVVLFHGRKHISYTALLLGGLVGAVLWIPWIEFQRVSDWSELKNWIGQIFQAPSEHVTAFLRSIDYLQSMLHASGFGYWFGSSRSEWPEYFPVWMHWGLGFSAVLLTGILMLSAIQIIIRRTDRRLLLLLLWVCLPVICGTLLRTGTRPENLLIAYPIPFVLVAMAIVQVETTAFPKARYASSLVVLVIVVLHVWYLSSLKQFVDDRHATTAGHYGLSYSQRQTTIEFILTKTGTDPVRLVGPYSGWYPAYEYVLMFEQTEQLDSPDLPLENQKFYWIDEQPPSENMSAIAWQNQKERQINLSISEYLLTAPNWIIENHWSVGSAQIYQLQFKIKKAFQ